LKALRNPTFSYGGTRQLRIAKPDKDSRQNKLPDRVGADEENHETTKKRENAALLSCFYVFSFFRAFAILFSKPGNLFRRDS